MVRLLKSWRDLDKLVRVGLVCILLIVFLGLVVPLLLPTSPLKQDYANMYSPPSKRMLMGGDEFGRGVFVRALVGMKYSLSIGLLSALLSGVAGTILGMLSAYLGRFFDILIQRLVDAVMSIPIFMLGLMVVVSFGTGYLNLLLAITIALSPRFARLARGSTLEVLDFEYIEAARAIGTSGLRIVWRHILPNIVGTIIVQIALFTGTAIIIESGISFLGLGIQPPTPSWGSMIKQGISVLSYAPWISLAPAFFLSITVLSVNILGDGLRNEFDPKAVTKKVQAQSTER